jgi:hypothetical protein
VHEHPTRLHDQGRGRADRTSGQHAALLRIGRGDRADQPRGKRQAPGLRRERPGPAVGDRGPSSDRDVGQRHEEYVANGQLRAAAAVAPNKLLTERRQLALEAQQIALRQRYVEVKIDYWHAIDAGDEPRAALFAAEASALAVAAVPSVCNRPAYYEYPAQPCGSDILVSTPSRGESTGKSALVVPSGPARGNEPTG